MKKDAPFLCLDPKEFIGRITPQGVSLITEPHWFGEFGADGLRRYRCLANVHGALAVVLISLTETVNSDPGSYNIRNSEIEKKLRVLAEFLKDEVPPGWGFTLMLFNFGEASSTKDGLFYMSSAAREDMIAAMKEFIRRNEH